MTRLLDRVVDRSDNVLAFPIFTVCDHPLVNVLTQSLTGDSLGVARHEALLDEVSDDTYEVAA